MAMRVFFEALLSFLPLKDSDTLYILGDVIDRGPDGIKILKYIMNKSNIHLILGNHEVMMLEYLVPSFDSRGKNIKCSSENRSSTKLKMRGRWYNWRQNHNQFTLAAFHDLSLPEQEAMLQYLLSLPSHIEVTVNEQHFYLVHGFPGNSIHEEVWLRPSLADMENPLPGTTLVVGHTPVVLLEAPDEDQQARYFSLLDTSGEIMRIFHSPQNWIDIDCGASYQVPGQALGCLCLDNMAEIYITRTNNHLLKAIVSIPTSEGVVEHEVLLPRN